MEVAESVFAAQNGRKPVQENVGGSVSHHVIDHAARDDKATLVSLDASNSRHQDSESRLRARTSKHSPKPVRVLHFPSIDSAALPSTPRMAPTSSEEPRSKPVSRGFYSGVAFGRDRADKLLQS